MTSVILRNDLAVLANGSVLITLPLSGGSEKSNKLKLSDGSPTNVTADISPCGRFIAICDDAKKLTLYRTEGLEIVWEKSVEKRLSKLTFTPDSNRIVTADKTGDVYLFDVRNNEKDPGKLLLGHLSMLSDVRLTRDSKFILTSDRDEKIRISRFPNSYNIYGFCLGHSDFITEINVIDDRRLVSASGDGTVKLWRFLEGKEVKSIRPADDLKRGEPTGGAVVAVKVYEKERAFYLIVAVENSEDLLVYELNGEDLFHRQTLNLGSTPIDYAVNESGSLWVISEGGILAFKFREDEFKRDDSELRCWKDELTNIDFGKNGINERIVQFQKKLIDNTIDYQKRKEERLSKLVTQSELPSKKRRSY